MFNNKRAQNKQQTIKLVLICHNKHHEIIHHKIK